MNKQSKRFYEILDVIKELHDKKRHDYADTADIFANFRSTEPQGVTSNEFHIHGLKSLLSVPGRICNNSDFIPSTSKCESTSITRPDLHAGCPSTLTFPAITSACAFSREGASFCSTSSRSRRCFINSFYSPLFSEGKHTVPVFFRRCLNEHAATLYISQRWTVFRIYG